jgi:hypothetical protein
MMWRGSLPPGHAEYFSIITGPLPTDAGQLFFIAKQTYDNGVTVDWNQPETPGGPEVAHPAPILHITGGRSRRRPPPPAPGAEGVRRRGF